MKRARRILNPIFNEGNQAPVIFYPGMHRALFRIKKACALANAEIGALKPEISRAVVEACDRALAGEFDKEFQLDMWQAAMPPTKSSRAARSGRRAPEHPCEQGPVDERHHSVRHAPCRSV